MPTSKLPACLGTIEAERKEESSDHEEEQVADQCVPEKGRTTTNP
jgi:hypothetical protein